MDSTPAVVAVDTSHPLSLAVAANKRLLPEIATVEESRQQLDSKEIRSERHPNSHWLLNPAVDSVSIQLVKIRPKRFDRLLGVETRNALHLVVQLLAAELPLTRLLASLHSAKDSVAATESMDWRPVLRHWKSKHATAVAS